MTRSSFLLALLLVLVAGLGTACSSATPTAPPSPAASSSPAAPAGAAPAQHTVYPLTITQPDGTTAVLKAAPKRIVTVGNPRIPMDDVVALGVAPVGGEVYRGADPTSDSRGIPQEIAGQITTFTAVGTPPTSPDLEAIAALHPDLIVGVGTEGGGLKQLEAVAPVESPGSAAPAGTGIESLESVAQVRLLGRILDRQAQANAFIARLNAAVAPVRAAVAGKSVDLVNPSPQGSNFFWFGADAQPTGHFLAALGLVLPTTFPGGGKPIATGDETYSMEHVSDLSAQYLVLGANPTADAAFLANPLVKQLPSVKAGRVIITKANEGFGDGYLIAGAIGQFKALPGIQHAFTTTGTPR